MKDHYVSNPKDGKAFIICGQSFYLFDAMNLLRNNGMDNFEAREYLRLLIEEEKAANPPKPEPRQVW